MPLAFPLINGDYYSFADIEFRFNGLFFVGVKSINYSDSLGRQFVRGTASKPLGKTRGNYEAKGDVEFYKPAFDLLIQSISALGAAFGGWRRVPFTVTVSYGSVGPVPLPATTDIITGVMLTECDASQSQSEDALTRKLTMMPQEILWGGISSLFEPAITAAIG